MATKNIENANVNITDLKASGNEVSFKASVDGKNLLYFDIDFVDDKNNKINIVEKSTKLNEVVEYKKVVKYNTNYKIEVVLYTKLAFVYDLSGLKDLESSIKTEVNPDGGNEDILYDDFQIHFLELGNDAAGDSVYIKAGENDILIDAGSTASSAETIKSYVDTYCTDGKLEYVIATHGHTDHIASFAGNKDTTAKNFKGELVGQSGIFYYYEIDTLIDFNYAVAKKNGSTKEETFLNKEQISSDFGSTTLYGKYLKAREYIIGNGTKYYTAGDCFNNVGDAKSTYELKEGMSMDILYNYYYFNESSDVNNYSVCTMFNYNDHHFMLTGDLELEGEEKMASYYDGSSESKTLPHVDLFKAGHHGSKTSSNDCLLDKITPDICCVCCCAGTDEYTADFDNTFPTQEFINRIAKHTERVYVTSMYDEVAGEFKSMNGNIAISCNGTKIGVYSSVGNYTVLKDSEWFNGIIYLDETGKCSEGKKKPFFTSSTPGVTPRVRRVWPSNI